MAFPWSVGSVASLSAAIVACALLAGCAGSGEKASSIGYSSVEEARRAVLAKRGVQAREDRGWLIVEESAELVLWSFTPAGHEAYPAVVKRVITRDGDGINVHMTALCQADKAPCDRLIEQFKQLNNSARREIQRRSQQDRSI